MNYDWINLKKKFITKNTSNSKYTLKQFAIDEKINYATLRENAKGWLKEKKTKQQQKTDKIIDKIIERQIESEVEMNNHHYNIANRLLEVIGQTLNFESLNKSPKSINTLAKALKTLQEVQRTASDVDKVNGSGGVENAIEDFVKAVVENENANGGKQQEPTNKPDNDPCDKV